MTNFINKVIYTSKKKQDSNTIEKNQVGSFDVDVFKYNENITCDNSCKYEYNLDKENINNLLNKNYTKLDIDFINKIINIYNLTKNKIIDIIKNENKNLVDKIQKIKIDPLKSVFNYPSLISNLVSNKNTFNELLCDINNTYNNKIIFSIIISQILCKIKKCSNDNDFQLIKNKIIDNIKDIFKDCKR